jgi:hypothetical protein
LAAKQTRQPFPHSACWRADETLELVHIDLCGPIDPPTVGGNKYFMLLVDDCSRWCVVYMLKTKDQAVEAFVKYKAEAENCTGNKIKTVRSDRGGEFLAHAFQDICVQAGIRRQFTAPFTPQQNGVVERKNRTVMEMARALLKSMSMPGRYWGEAIRHSVYLQNRLPTRPMGDRTPYEAWNGKRPQLGHVRVFGCTGHVRPNASHLKKLDDRSAPMVYLGVEEGSKAHRMLNPVTNRVVVSRDVVFEEAVKWSWDVAESEVFSEIREEADGQFVPHVTMGGVSGDNAVHDHGFDQHDDSGGAIGAGHSLDAMTDSLSNSVQNPTTGSQSTQSSSLGSVQGSGSGGGEMEVDGEDVTPDGHQRYKSLNDIYEYAPVAELQPESEEDDSEEVAALLAVMEEPSCFRDAIDNPEWVQAMDNEMQSICKNGTWELATLLAGQKAIGLKWVYKLKRNSEGEIFKHKARLVAKGYVQKQGVDFEEVFAPVARLDTIRMILAFAANRGWEVHHLDVKTAFLNGDLEEEVYVAQPEGYVEKGKEKMVLKLSKALYGLRQAPRAWNIKLDRSLKNIGFSKCASEAAVYRRGIGKTTVILGVYVDDLVVTGGDTSEIAKFKQQMTSQFEMSDLGKLSYYLGIEVEQHEDFITIKQATYAKKILSQFGMADCNSTKFPMDPGAKLDEDKDGAKVDATDYRRIIGCLRYLLHTRPDLSYAVGMASRFMEKPTVMHKNAVKQIMRYIKGTLEFGLVYTQTKVDEVLEGYSDSDVGGDLVGRRSTGGMAFYLNESLVTWSSHKEPRVSLSSCEAEFRAATEAAKQALWLRTLLSELTDSKPQVVTLYVDNNSAIALMRNPVFHGRSKHIEIKYHFIRECVELGEIQVKRVGTNEQRADALTKALSGVKLAVMRHLLGVREVIPHQA